MRQYVRFCAAGILVILAVSFSGRLLALGDSLAVFQPWWALIAAGLGLALWHRWQTPMMLVIAALVLGPILWGRYAPVPPVPAPILTLYQKNMLYNSGGPEAMREDILASGADIVTLQEVSIENLSMLKALEATYPQQNICPNYNSPVGGVAIISRLPLAEDKPQCGAGNGIASLRLRLPDGRAIEAASIHLHWPFPENQALQASWVARRFRGAPMPLVVAGDFNMVPEGSVMHTLARAAKGHMLRPRWSSFPRFAPYLPLAIDHVIVPDGAKGRVSLRPLLGSDHYGLLAQIDF